MPNEDARAEVAALLESLPRRRITPDTITQPIIDDWYRRERGYRERIAELEAAASVMEQDIRSRIAASLRRAASGRREYAATADDDETRQLLLRAADCHDSCAQIIGDPVNLLDVIPSWRWTVEERASLRNKPSLTRLLST